MHARLCRDIDYSLSKSHMLSPETVGLKCMADFE